MVVLAVAAGCALSAVEPFLSAPLIAMAFGAILGTLWSGSRDRIDAGAQIASTTLLRAGVAMLGTQISIAELRAVGLVGLVLAAGTVVTTFVATIALGRLARVNSTTALLIAAGSSVCGAAAVAAFAQLLGATREQVAYAIAAVTVCGTLAMIVVPILALGVFDLSDSDAGMWAGASIHEVAQVTAAGTAISPLALKLATVVKLARVAMLVPLVAAVSSRPGLRSGAVRPKIPAFLWWFVALVAARSTLPLPAELLEAARLAAAVLLAAGLAGLGLQLEVAAISRFGLRPTALACGAAGLALTTSLLLLVATRQASVPPRFW
jgi:uncharacterized integral membrane protein (TIGR00698 family)